LGGPDPFEPLFPHKDVVVKAVVPAQHNRKTSHFCAVGKMIRGCPVKDFLVNHFPTDQIVNISPTLGIVIQRVFGRKNVMVNQIRPVTYFNEQIPVITVKEIPAHPGPLRLPVQPDTQGTIVDTIIVNLDIQRGMQFNAGNLISVKFPFQGNVVDPVIVNFTENTTQMTNDPILSTIVDGVITDNMGTNGFFTPTSVGGAEYRLNLVVVTRFVPTFRAVMIAGGSFC